MQNQAKPKFKARAKPTVDFKLKARAKINLEDNVDS